MYESLSTKDKLHAETARIHWAELQPHFARGSLLYVAQSLDLINVATQIAEDKPELLEPEVLDDKITYPSNQQAKQWYEANTEFWAVVVAPYVVVQEVQG